MIDTQVHQDSRYSFQDVLQKEALLYSSYKLICFKGAKYSNVPLH